MHNGVVVARTVFNPEGQQPRAWVEVLGTVRHEGNRAVVEV